MRNVGAASEKIPPQKSPYFRRQSTPSRLEDLIESFPERLHFHKVSPGNNLQSRIRVILAHKRLGPLPPRPWHPFEAPTDHARASDDGL